MLTGIQKLLLNLNLISFPIKINLYFGMYPWRGVVVVVVVVVISIGAGTGSDSPGG